MRDKLDDLAWLKHTVIESNRRIDDIPELNFDLISLDSLEKHPQLHAIVQASKLIRFHRLMKAAQASANAVTFDPERREYHVPEAAGAQEIPAPFSQNNSAPLVEPDIVVEPTFTDNDPQSASAELGTIDTHKTTATTVTSTLPPAKLKDTLLVRQEKSSPATPIEEDFSVQVDRDDNQPSDWSFDLNEAAAAIGEEAGESVDFIFPDDNFSDQKQAPTISSEIILPAPAVSAVETAASTQPTDSRELLVSKDSLKIKTPSAPAKATPDGAKAANSDDPDIDQRLLDELIKNYGDFTATRNLPATLEATKPAEPKYDNPDVETSPLFDEPITPQRQQRNAKKAGDLDRQLKKIIKDYGENDLYPRQSLVNLKTGGIAAFAVLGLVLGALYLFKAPSAVGPPQGRPAAPIAEAQKAAATKASGKNINSASKSALAGPEAANASTDPLTESKQEP